MQGDQFAQAARKYGDTIYRVAIHATKNPSDAEDVMQTVLLKLFEEKKPFQSEDHLKHWLLRVTVNESRKLLRSFWHRKRVSLEDWDGPATEDPEKADLFRAVMALDEKYRIAVYLYYYEQLTVAETAAILHAKQSTVQSWLLRARNMLRKELVGEPEITEQKGSITYVLPEVP